MREVAKQILALDSIVDEVSSVDSKVDSRGKNDNEQIPGSVQMLPLPLKTSIKLPLIRRRAAHKSASDTARNTPTPECSVGACAI